MKKLSQISLLILFLSLNSVYGQTPTPYAEWNFDTAANLTLATIGSDLVLVGTNTAIEGPSPDDGAVTIGVGSHYKFTHGISPAAGQDYINKYSILFDIRVPDVNSWRSLFQANGANTDDGELFVRNTGGTIGLNATGYSSKTLLPDEWYRLVMVVDNGTEYSLYLDGVKILNGNAQTIDSRFGLRESILLFGDNDGEDYPTDVARVSFYDSPLSQSEVEALGSYEQPVNTFLTAPYLQNATTSGITVMWETDIATEGILHYGLSSTYGHEIRSSFITTNAQTYVHKAILTNLEANTQYQYVVEVDTVSSEPGKFVTAPDANDASFTVGLWADSHYPVPWLYMAKYMMEELQADFAFNAGDISNSGNNKGDIQQVFLPYVCGSIGSKIPFYSALGNHDVGTQWGGGNLIRQFHDQPKAENSDPNGFNGSYLMMYSNVAFIAIDWNKSARDLPPGGWLENVLKSEKVQNARFRFIFIHNAPYYERWQVAENDVIKNNLPTMAAEYNVDVVFSGHMHGYERGDKDDVQFITMGGGSYMDVNEPVGPIIYDHIIRGTNKPDNPRGFNNGLTNHLVSLHVEGNITTIKLSYFTSAGEFMSVMETIEIINPASSVFENKTDAEVRIVNDFQMGELRLSGKLPFMIELYSITGKHIYSDNKLSLRKEINTNSFHPGIYIFRITNSKGITTRKIKLN